MKKILNSILLLAAFLGGAAHAQEFYVGAHTGALGTGSESKIGYGIHIGANPYGWAAFQVDATFASLNEGTFFSSSPAVVLYPVNFEEFKIGFIGGAGFYKFPQASTYFGLNYGVTGDFHLTHAFSVGLETRYHPVFGAPSSVWTVFLTASYHFETADGGW